MQAGLLENEVPSLFFSLEMGLIEMTNRLLAASGKFKFNDLHFHRVDKDRYRGALQDLKRTPTKIITRQTEGKIDVGVIERFVVEYKPKVVFIDYLTLIDGADMSWSAEVSVTAQLKKIALQHNCLIITAAQADAESLKSGEIPDLHNIRGNKGFSFDADVVLALASQRIEGHGDTRMKIRYAIRKSRNGGFCEFAYRVNPNTGFWEEATGELF